MLSKFSQFYRYGNFVAINDDFLYAIYTENLFTHEETGGLIGLTYPHQPGRHDLLLRRDDQQRLRRAEEPGLSPTDSLFDYFLVSTHLSFFDYFNEYFYPYFQKRAAGSHQGGAHRVREPQEHRGVPEVVRQVRRDDQRERLHPDRGGA